MSVVLPWGPPAVPQFCLCQGQCRVVATGQWGGPGHVTTLSGQHSTLLK